MDDISRTDPTALTTQALTREVEALKELVMTRLDAMDKAMGIFSDNLTRAPTEVDKQIAHLNALTRQTFITVDEKFASVQTQFRERDVRTEQTAKDSKVAVDAALSAQKEAAGASNASNTVAIVKSEAAFTKQIDGITDLIRTTYSGWDRQVGDIKERITRIESEYVGRTKEVSTQQASSAGIISMASLIAGIIGLIVGTAITFLK